jgi:hypothetical protein
VGGGGGIPFHPAFYEVLKQKHAVVSPQTLRCAVRLQAPVVTGMRKPARRKKVPPKSIKTVDAKIEAEPLRLFLSNGSAKASGSANVCGGKARLKFAVKAPQVTAYDDDEALILALSSYMYDVIDAH